MLLPDVLALGVDGGASGVRALAVRPRSDGRLEAAGVRATRAHAPFAASDVEQQQGESIRGVDPRPEPEVAAARARLLATADVIVEAAGGARILAVGVCMPGLKTPNGRGIAVLRNGPRDPRFLEELERELTARGVELSVPIPALVSDGVAGALGERQAADGALAGVGDAYYLAGGTGLAEALLVGGRVRALDEFAGVLRKAWALESAAGIAYEDVLSMGGWNRAWERAGGILPPAEGGAFPEAAALRADPRATAILTNAADALARLVLDRVERLRARAGIELRRAVVGARLGRLLARPELGHLLRGPAERRLAEAGLPRDFLRASAADDAVLLGAASLVIASPRAPGREGNPCRS